MQYGSQIEQDDTRTEIGREHPAHQEPSSVGGFDVRIDRGPAAPRRRHREPAPSHRAARVRLDGMPGHPRTHLRRAHQRERDRRLRRGGLARPARWLRFVLGGRARPRRRRREQREPDRGRQGVRLQGTRRSSRPRRRHGRLPRDVARPLRQLRARLPHERRARRSSRARRPPSSRRPRATRSARRSGRCEGLSVSAVAFLLDLTVGAHHRRRHGVDSPFGSTRRYGGELAGRYQLRHGASTPTLSLHRGARAVTPTPRTSPRGTVYPATLRPIRTFSAGVGGRQPAGPVTLDRLRPRCARWPTATATRGRRRSSRPAGRSSTRRPACGGSTWSSWRTLLNVGDVKWREGQFEVNSRLPNEGTSPAPPAGISFTPGLPRTLMVHGGLLVTSSLSHLAFLLAPALACTTYTTDNFENPPPPPPATCVIDNAVAGCTAGSVGYTCTSDRPDDGDTNLVCSAGARGADTTAFCCLPYAQYFTECTTDTSIVGCADPAFGFSCAGQTTPAEADANLACSVGMTSDGAMAYSLRVVRGLAHVRLRPWRFVRGSIESVSRVPATARLAKTTRPSRAASATWVRLARRRAAACRSCSRRLGVKKGIRRWMAASRGRTGSRVRGCIARRNRTHPSRARLWRVRPSAALRTELDACGLAWNDLDRLALGCPARWCARHLWGPAAIS